MGPKPQGYVIVAEEQVGSVTALSRRRRLGKHGDLMGMRWSDRRWIGHPSLTECFVHKTKSISRAIACNTEEWLGQAKTAYPARYRNGYAQIIGDAISFNELRSLLAQQA